MNHNSNFRSILGMALVVVLSSIGSALPVAAGGQPEFPSPLSGPGVAAVTKSQKKKIERGWRELVAGNLIDSRKRTARAGRVSPALLLEFQIRLVDGETDITDELAAFCDKHPEYGAAWMTLSVAAEGVGLEPLALEAARHGSRLWTTPPWGDRAADLYQLWVLDRTARARKAFEAGDSSSALAELEAADGLDPNRPDSVLLAAEIFFSNGQFDEAEGLLAEIPGDPDGQFLIGRIAEERGNWQSAMETYSSLPEDHPGRAPALERVQVRWRLTLLPEYARAAMAAESLTRGDLAVLLVSIQPRLETIPGGAVPVMSDIVDYPGQREIITVVRLGIMDADRRGLLFYPNGPASMETVREAVQRSRALLGRSAPVWCSREDVVGSGCTSIPSPPSGGAVINVVLDSRSGANR